MNLTLQKGSPRCLSPGRAPTKWAKWLKRSWESLEVGSTISRLNPTLTQQFEAWRQRPLQQPWRILYLDGVHLSIRQGEKTDSTIILTALGVDLVGNQEVLARRSCAEEDKDGWACLLQDLRARGATQIDLIVTDGPDGLLAAVSELFSATPRQRWQVAQATQCIECHSSTRAR
jgi:transposase-like protein